jgi:hypothetical protein
VLCKTPRKVARFAIGVCRLRGATRGPGWNRHRPAADWAWSNSRLSLANGRPEMSELRGQIEPYPLPLYQVAVKAH